MALSHVRHQISIQSCFFFTYYKKLKWSDSCCKCAEEALEKFGEHRYDELLISLWEEDYVRCNFSSPCRRTHNAAAPTLDARSRSAAFLCLSNEMPICRVCSQLRRTAKRSIRWKRCSEDNVACDYGLLEYFFLPLPVWGTLMYCAMRRIRSARNQWAKEN